jgi:DNA primase catalytic core
VLADDFGMERTTDTGSPQRSTEAVERLHDQLEASLTALVTSEDWRRALEVAAKFHGYSFANTQLIWAQAQAGGFTPTRVTGYRTWRSLGRQVRRGEKGLAILAPIVRNVAVDGEVATEEPERRLVGFKPVHVFDISQTDGEPLPDTSPILLEGDLPARWELIARLIADAGYSLDFEADAARLGSANGVTNMTDRHVAVKEGLSGAQRFKTGVHELAHIRLHQPDSDGSPDCRGIIEVEAESVAYMVCASVGIDSTDYSLPYVASWSGGDIEKVTATANRVIGCAHEIVERLELSRELERSMTARESVEEVRVPSRQIWDSAAEPDPLPERTNELEHVMRVAVAFYRHQLTRPVAGRARTYLAGRGFHESTCAEWQLGYAPPSWNALTQHLRGEGFDDELLFATGVAGRAESGRLYDLMRGRIIFPVLDEHGEPRGLAGRQIVGDGPRYLNGPETSLYAKRELLFGLNRASDAIATAGEAIIVEGYTDVIAAHQAGLENVIGTSGTAITERQLALVRESAESVVLAFDGDSGGLQAIENNSDTLQQSGLDIRVAVLPPDQDPASLLTAGKVSQFIQILYQSDPLAIHMVGRVLERCDLDGVEGPIRAIYKTARLLGQFRPADRSLIAQHLAHRLGRDLDEVDSMLEQFAQQGRSLSQRDVHRSMV